tara:strand:+ start:135 stop:332 length:198 start_codon:yes stop_codon:yes gene_type:complete
MKLLKIDSGMGIREQIKGAANSEDLAKLVKEIATALESGKLKDVPSKTQARWERTADRRRKELVK